MSLISNWHKMHAESLSWGDKIADRVAEIMGSWNFIIWQSAIVFAWISFNLIAVLGLHWDPYPFILLNLLFSTQAAYAAPIIMMSQNRQADRDRIQAEADYETNRLAKEEIESLTKELSRVEREKLDKIIEMLLPEIDDPAILFDNEYNNNNLDSDHKPVYTADVCEPHCSIRPANLHAISGDSGDENRNNLCAKYRNHPRISEHGITYPKRICEGVYERTHYCDDSSIRGACKHFALIGYNKPSSGESKSIPLGPATVPDYNRVNSTRRGPDELYFDAVPGGRFPSFPSSTRASIPYPTTNGNI